MKKLTIDFVIESIKKGESFIVEAGAGSGKTHTLILALNIVLENYSKNLNNKGQKISCITFTNIAKDEIINRTENNTLIDVHTIHEFLWSCISNFQAELHLKLNEINIEYERQRKEEKKRTTYEFIPDLLKIINDKKIEYTEYGRNFKEGKITHEDVILISYYMFRDYPVLSEIIANKFPFIFVDEYQDTEEETVWILLDHILKAKNKCIIGFFGDSMQKIYDAGIGEINNKYYDKTSKESHLNFITKNENYRCSRAVIKLLNKIRANIQQVEGNKNKNGSISLFIGNDLEKNLIYLENNFNWNFKSEDTKILFLTHSGIAQKLGYNNLLSILSRRYGQFGRERFFNKDEIFSRFFIGDNGVEKLIENYESEKYGEIIEQLKKVGYSIINHNSKEILKKKINELNEKREKENIANVLNYLKTEELLIIPDKISDFEKYIARKDIPEEEKEKAEKMKEYYNSLMSLKYEEIIEVNKFIEEKTIYSTKHGTKGTEFENVLIVIDGAWPQKYNFIEVFEKNSKYNERLKRSLNLFYVCCSRAKNNLGVLLLADVGKYKNAMITLTDWFEKENIYRI